jgi:hypothetical protein
LVIRHGILCFYINPILEVPVMALTKDDIIGSLQSGLGFSRSDSSRCLESPLEISRAPWPMPMTF